MISGYRIVCFGDEEWEYEGALQRMARTLARTNDLIYVTSLGVRVPRPSIWDFKKVVRRVRSLNLSPSGDKGSVPVITPLTLPLYNVEAGVALSGRIVFEQLKRAGVFETSLPLLLWVGVPTAAPIISRLSGVPYFFHATDYQSAYPGVTKHVIAKCEEQLACGAAFCVTASERMAQKLESLNPRTHWIDHSVDVQHFQRPSPEPDELRNLPKPIFGYVGGITSWLDQDAIAILAAKFPDASVVLVGKEVVSTRKLRGLKNVHILGPKPYGQIPAYVRDFDVCLLPRELNDWQAFANPLVILEYFALGKPVVSADLPFTTPHKELFHIYGSREEITVAALKALHEPEELTSRRREIARERQHPAATIELSDYIERYVGNAMHSASELGRG